MCFDFKNAQLSGERPCLAMSNLDHESAWSCATAKAPSGHLLLWAISMRKPASCAKRCCRLNDGKISVDSGRLKKPSVFHPARFVSVLLSRRKAIWTKTWLRTVAIRRKCRIN
jgi:hypothetical protein